MDELTVDIDELVLDSVHGLEPAITVALAGSGTQSWDESTATQIGRAVARSLSTVLPPEGGNHENSGHLVP
jgi:hypothetical protein